ncbi:formate--tetrahydrofolate ligase [Halorubrum sp. Atlit-8R]|uniref:formate--tetrahydrofolate ligase n=1 Tax=unclassified Halorubrum TaxID=2642239 RepID=UPI000EF245C4|nr:MULTISPECIES: formate--tetrahydrofolate ligase [unclassified Halorubrum]RLM70571.1 formate--tetrahydrofolate ligase [Halorubrum sp. Atlit-9R]RLM83274.1 formate--tetrahydrofolate ligase [Halorubrum sp. Atlit-8R]
MAPTDPASDATGVPESDLAVARATDPRPIEEVAADLGLSADDVERRGDGVAKLTHAAVRDAVGDGADASGAAAESAGTTVLVTGMSPTPKGEGKTVTTVGLGQGLAALGERAAVAVREPSLGPVFGVKGGAAGGGRSQVLPMEAINLHFTGDIHALTAAHNLLAAALDNHLHQGNDAEIDARRVDWPRALDVNDRALRETVVGLGGTASGVPREEGFVITAASELTAVLGLATDLEDLKARIGRIVLAADADGEPVTPDDLGVTGAAAALLRDAFRPNLVQTVEGVPAFVHGGPFANIAHGTNTLVADRVGAALADYLVTEAGFGADLGAEKFGNIVARQGVVPDVAVVVATVRGAKRHGLEMWPTDFEALAEPAPEAVRAGVANVAKHVSIAESFGVPTVAAINVFADDTEAELAALEAGLEERGIPAARSTAHRDGGAGATDLAELVRDRAGTGSFEPLYDADAPIREKIATVAREVYGAAGVEYVDGAADDVERVERWGYADLPVCLSKTPYSLSDDPTRTGVPEGWTLTVREVTTSAGAGFVVAKTADVMTMPGLPAEPAAEDIDVDADGDVSGLF